VVERPLRLHAQLSLPRIESLRFASGDEEIRSVLHEEFGDDLFENFSSVATALEKRLATWGDDDEEEDDEEDGPRKKKGLPEKKMRKLLDRKTWERDARLVEAASLLRRVLGGELFEDHNVFQDQVEATLKKHDSRLPAPDLKQIYKAVSWREESAPPVIAKVHKPGKATVDSLHGRYEAKVGGKPCVVEYEPDSDLRDSEQIPLLEDGGIEAFIRREVLPYTPDAWVKEGATKIGYEVSFTRHFYEPPQLRTLAEISADIVALEQETEGLLSEITKGATA
jgi:type I restriction enzyme M protein